MARFNEILVGRYNRALQKLTGIKGPVPSPQLSSEIMPVLEMFRGAEERYVEGWNRFGRAIGNTGGAAQFDAYQWRNPAGSNVLVVFEKITVMGPAAADDPGILILTTNVDLTTLLGVSNVRLDARGNPQPSAQVSTTVNFVRPATYQLVGSYPVNGAYDFIITPNQELPLLPGDALQIFSNTVAITHNVAVIWRERFLEESERA